VKITTTAHRGDLRHALIRAALELLEEGDALSLRGVSRRAGVSHAAPYHHFVDRGALEAAVAVEGFSLLRRSMCGERSNIGRGPVTAAESYARFALSQAELFRLMFDCAAEHTDDSALVDGCSVFVTVSPDPWGMALVLIRCGPIRFGRRCTGWSRCIWTGVSPNRPRMGSANGWSERSPG